MNWNNFLYFSLYNKSQSTDKDPVNKAATTIQAGYKGYKVRKEIKKDGKSSDEGSPVKQSTGQQDIDAEIVKSNK